MNTEQDLKTDEQETFTDLNEEKLDKDLRKIRVALKNAEKIYEADSEEAGNPRKTSEDLSNSSIPNPDLINKNTSPPVKDRPMRLTRKFLQEENKQLRVKLKELDRQVSGLLEKATFSEAPFSKGKKQPDPESAEKVLKSNWELNVQKRLKIYKKEYLKLKLRHAQVNDPNYEVLLSSEISQKEGFLSKFEKIIKTLGRDQDFRVKSMELLGFDGSGQSISELYEELSKISYRSKKLEKLIKSETEQYYLNKQKEVELLKKISLSNCSAVKTDQNLQYKYDYLKEQLSYLEKSKLIAVNQLKIQAISLKKNNEMLFKELEELEEKVRGKNSFLKNIGGQLEQTVKSGTGLSKELKNNNTRSSSLTKLHERTSKIEDLDLKKIDKGFNKSVVFKDRDLPGSNQELYSKKFGNAGITENGAKNSRKIGKKKIIKTEEFSRFSEKPEAIESKHKNPNFQNAGNSVIFQEFSSKEETISSENKAIKKHQKKKEGDNEKPNILPIENLSFFEPVLLNKGEEKTVQGISKENIFHYKEGRDLKRSLVEDNSKKTSQIDREENKQSPKEVTNSMDYKDSGSSVNEGMGQYDHIQNKILSKISEKSEFEESKRFDSSNHNEYNKISSPKNEISDFLIKSHPEKELFISSPKESPKNHLTSSPKDKPTRFPNEKSPKNQVFSSPKESPKNQLISSPKESPKNELIRFPQETPPQIESNLSYSDNLKNDKILNTDPDLSKNDSLLKEEPEITQTPVFESKKAENLLDNKKEHSKPLQLDPNRKDPAFPATEDLKSPEKSTKQTDKQENLKKSEKEDSSAVPARPVVTEKPALQSDAGKPDLNSGIADPFLFDIDNLLKNLSKNEENFEVPNKWENYAGEVFDLIRINNSSLDEPVKPASNLKSKNNT